MSKSIKVRFNLGKGVNYMKWKIEYPDGRVLYSDPELEVRTDDFIDDRGIQVRYNPRVKPNWLINDVVVDGKTSEQLHTINKGVFISGT